MLVNKLTKFALFIPTTTSISASDTAALLFKHRVKVFGLPSIIIGDRDPHWTSTMWKCLASLFNSHLALSTSKHSQTDGQTEVFNQHLETMLRVYIQADQKDWAEWLDVLQLAYNNSTHSSHKSAPAELLLGYRPHTPLDFSSESGLNTVDGHPDLQSCLKELQAHRNAARDAIQRSLDKQAYQYDKGHCLPCLEVSNEVLINPHALELVDVKGESQKLVQRKISPFETTEVLSPTTY